MTTTITLAGLMVSFDHMHSARRPFCVGQLNNDRRRARALGLAPVESCRPNRRQALLRLVAGWPHLQDIGGFDGLLPLVNHAGRSVDNMEWPPIDHRWTRVSISSEKLARLDELAGEKGRSEFIQDALHQVLDRVATVDESVDAPYLEYSGRYEARLTPSGTAAVLYVITQRGWDDTASRLGLKDPVQFLRALLGHRPLPEGALSYMAAEQLGPSVQ